MPSVYVALTQAADEVGVCPNTLKRRFRSLDLTIFRDSRDLRRRLIRRTDLEAAFGPPIPTNTPPRVTPPGPFARDGARRQRDR